ncbi:MAG TPA: hypothetical protein VK210_11725 [Terriglobia bacterium]|nr:hypothetical protein [Terriglobia bacterium]
MKDTQSVRYIGYEGLPQGGRSLDFSYGLGDETKTVAIEVPLSFLQAGPDRIAIQEASSICYETLKARLHDGNPPARFSLTMADIARHRKIVPVRGHRKRVLAESV